MASLFNLFGSKDGLLIELISYATTPSLTFYERLNAVDALPEVKLYKSIYEEVIAVASADRDHAALFYLPELRKPELKPAQAYRAKMIEHYKNLVANGIRAGSLTATDATLAAEQIFQLTETTIIGGPSVTRKEPNVLAQHTAHFCLRSLLVNVDDLASVEAAAMGLNLRIELPT